MPTDRGAVLRTAGIVILIGNVVLVLAKGAVWYASGSLAVGSEAVNSLTDVAYSLFVLGGLYVTTQPPDPEHPHGHERVEPFVSLIIALGMIVAGGAIIWSAATAIMTGDMAVADGPAAVLVLLFAIALKLVLYRYCLRVGRAANSPAVIAAAADNRNDVFAASAALLGVAGAQAGYHLLDPAAALLVGVVICYAGYEIIRDNFNYLVGAAPPDDLRKEVILRALDHPEVEGVNDVIAHYVGPEIDVSMHIEVEGDHTLREAHEIETAVIESVRDLEQVDDVFVHIDPKELGEWKDDWSEPTLDERS